MTEKLIHISDMGSDVPDLKSQILDRAESGGSASVWTPADFLDLGTRDAVDKTLQRLVATRKLRRIDRGLYDKPTHNRLTKQPNPPDPRAVVEAIARRDQIRILVDGMTAANDLGLTNAVPAKVIVHTDARLKNITLGKLQIIFKPTAASKLYWAGRPAMRIVQALHWLRDTLSQDDEDINVEKRLTKLLNDPAHGDAIRNDLAEGLPTLPAWMQVMLRPLISSQSTKQ